MKIFLLFGAALMATGCSFLPEKHIHTEIEIQAPPQTVWEILVNNEAYPSWNPYHVKVEGKMETGSRLFVEIHKPNGEKVEIEPHVMRIIPFKELVWGGGLRGVFFGEHSFLLSPLGDQSTHLVHKEHFSGITIPFASLDSIEEGYQLMNEALKARAESP